MYFVFEIEFHSQKQYIKNLIKAYIKGSTINARVIQSIKKIYIEAPKEQENLDKFLLGLEQILPASLFLGHSKHYYLNEPIEIEDLAEDNLPLNISLCPNCQKEMFDISSNRYYYPFTSCNSCGGQHPFLEKYPFSRKDTTFKFLSPCPSCEEELKKNPFRENYPLVSCLECGINLKMKDKKSERYANDKGSFKQLFEVAAKAINKDKTILVKTLNGYRKFFKASKDRGLEGAILLFCDANVINSKLMLIPQEFHSLLSIERPILRISTKSDDLKALFGSSTYVKYADDGITMLLAKELLNLGLSYICYKECTESEDADYLIDFDIPITPQKDTILFINQDTHLFVKGERAIFPLTVQNKKNIMTIANSLAAVPLKEQTIIDKVELFEPVESRELRVLEGENIQIKHIRERKFKQREGSMLSVLAENNLIPDFAIEK